ncbi:MAG TPA: DUF2298 domain-containing protein [Candidatus Limnocylindria bacterium]|nr:DUF2298 domain-containing protein [Candidatus Limnocylindria bacterium]
MLAVWPALFVVPGCALVAVTRPRVGTSARVGLAVALSVAVSAHAVYWLALLTGGYERWTVFAVTAALLLPIPLAAWHLGGDGALAGLRGALRAARREWAALAFGGVTAAAIGVVLQLSLWRPVEGGVAAGGSNWSDLGVHLSIAQSLNAGNFPPQVPFFAGAPLVYHWFADFHAAIAARAAGIFAVPAFVVSSAVMAGALALLVHGLARRLLRDRRARRAALVAAALVVFGGGLGWVRLAGDVATGLGSALELVAENSYDNSWFDAAGNPAPMWPYFRIPSVMGTGLLVHRATTYGLPILLAAILLLVAGLPTDERRTAGWRDRPSLIGLAGLTGAMLAPFHFFFFPAFLLLALLYVVAGHRLLDVRAPNNAVLLLGPTLLAVPFGLAAAANAAGSGSLRLVAGWESAPWADGAAAVAFFYTTNLGVPFVLAVVALLVAKPPWRLFLGGWLVALFVVPNVVQVSHVAFDMNKYFQAMWVAVALLAAWLLRRWPWPAVALVLLLSVPSPLLVAAYTAANREQVLSTAELRAAEWIARSTPAGSVFATDGWLNSPTDPAGRLRLLTFTPYVANLGYDPDQREQQLFEVYCGGDPAHSAALLRELGADYVVDSRRPAACVTPTDFAGARGLEQAYAADGIAIWRVTDEASGRP